ncbi:MAG: DUF3298 domain-containing protein [Saprospiraceae bacterium]|nr:DUF3298 domain-containing protein [Saprospiraceae bacterium]
MSNFFKKTLPLLCLLLTLMSACDNSSKKNTPSVSEASTAQKGFYKHFKGTIGDFAVTMDLIKNVVNSNREAVEAWAGFSGSYYYDKYQEPISIYGSLDSTGTIVLEEWVSEGKSATIRGNLTPEGTFVGTWQDTSGKKILNIVLKETYSDGAIGLESIEYTDSFRLFEKLKNSPVAIFGMDMLLPTQNTERGISTFLKNEIFGNMLFENPSDEAEKKKVTKEDVSQLSLADLQKSQRDSFFTYYRESMKDEKPDSAAEYFSQSYSRTSQMEVLFNEKGLLSVGFAGYSYDGGAHGYHATALASYDLATKKQLTLNDVFKPNYPKELNKALEKALRTKYALNPKEGLGQMLFDNSIAANDNFALTRKGILFCYTPYEIAAYAYGEIQLYVPFEEVKTLLK